MKICSHSFFLWVAWLCLFRVILLTCTKVDDNGTLVVFPEAVSSVKLPALCCLVSLLYDLLCADFFRFSIVFHKFFVCQFSLQVMFCSSCQCSILRFHYNFYSFRAHTFYSHIQNPLKFFPCVTTLRSIVTRYLEGMFLFEW